MKKGTDMKEERIKELMEQVGMPDSQSLMMALQQVANETEQRVRASYEGRTKWVVEALNVALENDPVAIQRLFKNRVVCNTDLADHRSVQVLELPCGRYTIGVIGFINMVLVELGYPKVCSLHNEEGELTGFDLFRIEKGET